MLRPYATMTARPSRARGCQREKPLFADTARSACGFDVDETQSTRRGGETTLRSLAVHNGHFATHLTHHVDHFIGCDGEVEPGKGHLCSRDGLHCRRRVAIDAGNLDEAADRIAYQSEHSLQRQRYGGSD